MDTERFDGWIRNLGTGATRRGVLATLGGAAALGLSEVAAKKKRPKKCKNCCLANGSACKKKGPDCKPKNCTSKPVTITLSWTTGSHDHDSYLFVPNQSGSSVPFPFISAGDDQCHPPACEDAFYPFACIDKDAGGPGDEVTTIKKLIPGKYEFWVALEQSSLAEDATVKMKTGTGSDEVSLKSPASDPGTEDQQQAWHVFDITVASDGKRTITEVNDLVGNPSDNPRAEMHDPATSQC